MDYPEVQTALSLLHMEKSCRIQIYTEYHLTNLNTPFESTYRIGVLLRYSVVK